MRVLTDEDLDEDGLVNPPGLVDRARYSFRPSIAPEEAEARAFNEAWLTRNQGRQTSLSARPIYSKDGDLAEVTLLAFLDRESLQDFRNREPARREYRPCRTRSRGKRR